MDARFLRRIFASVVKGYSPVTFQGRWLFFRHLSILNQSDIDTQYALFQQRAVDEGLPTNSQRLALIEQDGSWTPADELSLSQTESRLQTLKQNKTIGYLPSQIEGINAEIKQVEEELSVKQAAKYSLIGYTAESFADRRINEIYIYENCFFDTELLTPAYTQSDFENLDNDELTELVSIYNTVLSDFNETNLKHIAFNSFFQNLFSLCEDNVSTFLGKPIAYLTYYQTELVSWGKYFKHLLSLPDKPPADMIQDPDQLIDWATGSKNSKAMLDKKIDGEGQAMSLVGATAQDLKAMGVDQDGPTLAEEAKKKGGSLSMQDMMKMGGVMDF